MRPKFRNSRLSSLSTVIFAGVLASSSLTQAATYYWDADGTASPGFSTVVGAWNTGLFWNSDATGGNSGIAVASPTFADDLIIGAATTNTGTITVTGTKAASSMTFASAVGAVTISGGTSTTIGGTGASSGIFNQSSAAQTISTALILRATTTAFNFTNSGSGLLNIGTTVIGSATSGTQTLTVGSSSSGGITLGNFVQNGTGGGNLALVITNTGTGSTSITNVNNFSGGLTLNSGTLILGNSRAHGQGTFTINGGRIDTSAAIDFGASAGYNVAMNWNGDFTFVGTNTLNTSTGAVTLNNNRIVTGSSNTMTVGGVIGDGGNAYSLTKAGGGTLILNGAAVNTFTGGLKVNAGTLTLNFANLATPTNLINSGNALTLGGGNLSILGRATGTTSQTVNGMTVASGASTVTLARNGGTSATLDLGAVTRSAGGTVTFLPTTAWTTAASTTEIVRLTSVTNVNGAVTLPTPGNTGYIGAGFFTSTGASTRYAQVRNTGGVHQLVLMPLTTNFVTSGGAADTVYNINANQTLVGATTNYALIPTNTTAFALNQAGFAYTTNGILNVNTATLTISGGTVTIGAERDLVLNSANTGGITINSIIADNGGGASHVTISNAGTGATTFGGANNYTGTTTINSGGLVAAANTALGTTAGNTTVAAGAALGFSGGINYSTAETIVGSGGGTSVNVAGGPFTVTSRGFVQSVSGNNSFAGAIQIDATGTSRIGTQTGASLTLSGPITMASGTTGVTVLFRVGDTTNDFVTLSNSGNSWDGTTQIFTGNTSAVAGVGAGVRLGAHDALPTALTVDTFSGAGVGTMLDLAGFNQTTGGLTALGNAGNGALKISNSLAASTSILTLNTTANRDFGTSGVIQDGAGIVQLVKTGAFDQILRGVNTYTGGTLIKNGSITLLTGNDRLLTTGTVTLGDTAAATTGKLVLGDATTARNQTLAGLLSVGSGGSVVGANATIDSLLTLNIASGTNTFSGTLGGAGTNENKLALTKTGNGTMVLAGANTYTGTTTITGGTLEVQGSIASSSDIANDGSLVFNSSSAQSYAGDINGTGSLTKQGTGTLTFTGISNTSGETTVSNGTLLIGAAGQIVNGGVTVNGGTFRYNSTTDLAAPLTFSSGQIAGTNWNSSLGGLTIGAGMTISPGNSPGTATTDDQTWASAGTYLWEINDATGTQGTDPGWDLVLGTGTLDITATSGSKYNINITSLTLANAPGLATNFNLSQTYNWLIADFAIPVIGFAADKFNLDTSGFTNSFTGGSFSIALGDPVSGGDDTQVYLVYVPEPTTLALLACGTIAGVVALRRRKAKLATK